MAITFRSRFLRHSIGAVEFANYHAVVSDPALVELVRRDPGFGADVFEITPEQQASELAEALRNNAEGND